MWTILFKCGQHFIEINMNIRVYLENIYILEEK